MSGLEDSRVLSAFSAQQGALPYMINVEQRLGQFKSAIAALQAAGIDPAVLAQVNTNTADIATNTSDIAVLNSDVSAIETGYVKRNIAQDALISASISTASTTYVDTSLDVTLTTGASSLGILVLFSFPMSYVSAGVTAYGTVGVSVNGGSEIPISLVYTGAAGYYDLNGVAGSVFLGGTSGSTNLIRLRFKTTSGTFFLSDPSFPGYSSLTAIEI